MSASRGGKKIKKNLKPRRERLIISGQGGAGREEEVKKSSKFTVIGRCLNVPFKLYGMCHKLAWVLLIPPCFCFGYVAYFSFPFKLRHLLLPDTGSPKAPTFLFPFTLVHYAL